MDHNANGTVMADDEQEIVLTDDSTAPVTRLSALETLFTATGTVDVKVGIKTIRLPIQSVDTEIIDAFVKPYRPVAPTRAQLENGRRVVIENQADRAYQDKLAEYNRIWLLAVVFHGLAVDIVDNAGQVVWSADNSLHDLQATRQVAKRMGLVDNQLGDIVKAINDLTRFTEEAQGRD